MTLSMSKLKQNSWFVVRKYLLFTGKLYFFSDYKFYRGSCLICLIRSYGTAGELSRCYHSSEKNYVGLPPFEFGGLNPSFVICGLSLPSPYVQPPLPHTLIQ